MRPHPVWYSCLFILCLNLTAYQTTRAETALSGPALIAALKQGGYSIYFRHEKTDWSLSDNLMNSSQRFSCDPSKMRQLSPEGRDRARKTGRAMRKSAIPVSEVIASPYCRTVETAELMELGPVTKSNSVMNLRVAEYYGGRDAVIASAKALLSTSTRPGFNRLIVAHGNVAQAATPIYPDEGEAAIFKADGMGGFRAVGRIKPNEW